MSMVQLALRRPYTFIVMAMLIVLATPFAARLINRTGPWPALILGSITLLVGSVLLLLFDAAERIWDLRGGTCVQDQV